MIDDDLGVFYDTQDFAVEFWRTRAGVPAGPFSGLYSAVDEDALDGHAITGMHRLRYPTAAVDLVEDDIVAVTGQGTFKVRRADRVNDGRETEAVLRKVSS